MFAFRKVIVTDHNSPISTIESTQGMLLNLVAKSVDMAITGFSINCRLPEGEEGTLYVWTKEGDHYADGAWHSEFKWDRVLRKTKFTCAGVGEETTFFLDKSIKIAANTWRAFHIYVDHDDWDTMYPTVTTIRYNWCDGGDDRALYKEDNFLAIHAGSGNWAQGKWNAISSPQVMSGKVFYSPAMAPVNGTDPYAVVATPAPSWSPTSSFAPTGTLYTLNTPSPGNGWASAYGYMFDVMSKSTEPIRIISFGMYFKVGQCGYKLWSRLGGSYHDPDAWGLVSNEPEFWDLIGEGNITNAGGNRGTLSYGKDFKVQTIPPGERRAFYVAFFNCDGSWPLAVNYGDNYYDGVAAEDDNIALMEGIKKDQLNINEPITYKNFGSNYISGNSPGADYSAFMRGGSITYDFDGVSLLLHFHSMHIKVLCLFSLFTHMPLFSISFLYSGLLLQHSQLAPQLTRQPFPLPQQE